MNPTLHPEKPVYDVAVALVERGGRWLVTERRPDAHLGGMWEFPGGKREPGETPPETALRELREECGVIATGSRTLPALVHDYHDRVVRITAVFCTWMAGEPQPIGCTECRWLTPAELAEIGMPAINAAIIEAIASRH